MGTNGEVRTITISTEKFVDIYESKHIPIYSKSMGSGNAVEVLMQVEPSILLRTETDIADSLWLKLSPYVNTPDKNLKDIFERPYIRWTPRPPNTTTYFTGVGDDPNNVSDVGNGTSLEYHHTIGGSLTGSVTLDFNCITNETWVYEGSIWWNGCLNDKLTFKIVPRTVTYTTTPNTNYTLYGGYMVLPAAGNGNINVTSDLTLPTGGLVEVPYPDPVKKPAFWNATFNTSSKKFENITPAPTGNGRFNMFTVPVTLFKFVNKLNLLGNGTHILKSNDAEMIGHGMRFVCDFITSASDHNWDMSCCMTMYRARTV